MSKQEYERLARAIADVIRQQGEPLSPRATFDHLTAHVEVDLEVLRATVSAMVVAGELQVSPDF